MPRAFLITHRRYNSAEEELGETERGMLLVKRACIIYIYIFDKKNMKYS